MKLYVDPNVLFGRNLPPPSPPTSDKKKDRDDFKTYLRVKKYMDKVEEERKKAESEKKKKEAEKKALNPWAIASVLVFLSPLVGASYLWLFFKIIQQMPK